MYPQSQLTGLSAMRSTIYRGPTVIPYTMGKRYHTQHDNHSALQKDEP